MSQYGRSAAALFTQYLPINRNYLEQTITSIRYSPLEGTFSRRAEPSKMVDRESFASGILNTFVCFDIC